jgi:hypothetical protein
MSEDFYLQCPICNHKDVRVDNAHDIYLHEDGTMTTDISAKCTHCNKIFILILEA